MLAFEVPPYSELLWPAMIAVRDRGGSVSIDEMVRSVIAAEALTEAQQGVLHGDGPETEIGYRLAWARTYLKGMGLLTNSRRGVWTLTANGHEVVDRFGDSGASARDHMRDLWSRYVQELRAAYRAKRASRPDDQGPDAEGDDLDAASRDWKEELLDTLMNLRADTFERLAQRLLREAGFLTATVTGRSGDGGIDGVGVYRMSLLSFPVFFQCKRYKGSVGSGAVRDFRGAMAGRGDKGLLITTGTFTSDAKVEATRDGAPPIDLIDGDRLCDLLKEYEVGVRVTLRQIEDVGVDVEFFNTV
ncbi:MAG TPA: restriction endonuclease [Vicinamibacterales bacterium]